MTGAQTDRSVPQPYQQAVCLLLKLTPALMAKAMLSEVMCDGEKAFDDWYSIRYIVEIYNRTRSTVLGAPDRERMIGALKFAHDLAHEEMSFTPSVDTCPCHTAGILRDLAKVLEAARVEEEEKEGLIA